MLFFSKIVIPLPAVLGSGSIQLIKISKIPDLAISLAHDIPVKFL